jgi:hypothetical protein
MLNWDMHKITINNQSDLDLYLALVYNNDSLGFDERTGFNTSNSWGKISFGWYVRAGESVNEFWLGVGGEFQVYFTTGRDWIAQHSLEEYPGRYLTGATYGRLTEPLRFDCFLAQDDREFSRCERHVLLTYGADGTEGSEAIRPEEFP